MITTISKHMATRTMPLFERVRLVESQVREVVSAARVLIYTYVGNHAEAQPMSKTTGKPEVVRHPALEFDLERMKRAVEASKEKKAAIPHGLSFEEMREFMKNNAR